MKQKKFLEAACVRFQSSPSYPMVSDQSRTFFLTILPWFNAPHLQNHPGLLLTPDGSPITLNELSLITNRAQDEALACIKELTRHGFLGTAECGAVACQIAAEELRRHQFFVEAGKRGGNPKFKQGNGKTNQEKKATPYPTPIPTPLPNPPTQPPSVSRKQTRNGSAFLKSSTPQFSFKLPQSNPLYVKDAATGNTVNPLDFIQIARGMVANLGEFLFSIEGTAFGQPVALRGTISPKNNPLPNPYTNPLAHNLTPTQTEEQKGLTPQGLGEGLAGGLGEGLPRCSNAASRARVRTRVMRAGPKGSLRNLY